MPHIKPKVCHKCSQSYTGWRCPHCYGKAHKSSGGNRRATLRTFRASSVLSPACTSPIVAHDTGERYDDPRICPRCGYFTTTHPCAYCNKE